MTDDFPLVHGSFTLQRNYPQAPSRVFFAFSDKEMKRRWLIEGEGWEIFEYEADFRVGGGDSSRFSFQGGPELTNDTQYQDIVPDRRIVFSYRMTFAGKSLSASLVTVEFKALGAGTLLVYTEQGAYFDSPEAIKNREEGSRQILEKLAEELAKN